MMLLKLTGLSLLYFALSVRLCGMSGLPPDHESYARAALADYGRGRHTPLRLLSLSESFAEHARRALRRVGVGPGWTVID